MLPNPKRTAFTLLELLIVLVVIIAAMLLVWPSVDRMMRRSQVRSAARLMRSEMAEARVAAMNSGVAYVLRFQPGSGLYEIGPRFERESATGLGGMIAENNLAVAEATAAGAVAVGPDGVTESGDLGGPLMPVGPGMMPNNGLMVEPGPLDSVTGVQELSTDSNGLVQKELANGILFVGNRVSQATRDEATSDDADPTDPNHVIAQATSVMSGQSAFGSLGTSWSEAVVFYPNGRTSSVAIRMTCDSEPFYTIDVTLRGLTGSSHLGSLQRVEPIPVQTGQPMVVGY